MAICFVCRRSTSVRVAPLSGTDIATEVDVVLLRSCIACRDIVCCDTSCERTHASTTCCRFGGRMSLAPVRENDLELVEVASADVYSWWIRSARGADRHTKCTMDVGVLRECCERGLPLRVRNGLHSHDCSSVGSTRHLTAYLGEQVISNATNTPAIFETMRAYLAELALHIAPSDVWERRGKGVHFNLESAVEWEGAAPDYLERYVRPLLTDFVCYEWFHVHAPLLEEASRALYKSVQRAVGARRKAAIVATLSADLLPTALVPIIASYDLVASVRCRDVLVFMPTRRFAYLRA